MNDLINIDLRYISTMSAEAQHKWYTQINDYLPMLKLKFSVEDIRNIETEIENYEIRWME